MRVGRTRMMASGLFSMDATPFDLECENIVQ